MYTPSSMDFEESPFPTPSAPPCPPPPLVPSHSTIKTKPSKSNPLTVLTVLDSHHSQSPMPWSTGLCNCCADCHSCCLTCWCPCVTFGRIAEIVDRGSTSCGVSGALYMLIMCVTAGWCCCMYSCFYRSKLRGQYLLKETPCTDCCVHCCCQQCALCQEATELKSRGFDISVGWHGNMERNKRMAAKPPSIEGAMVR